MKKGLIALILSVAAIIGFQSFAHASAVSVEVIGDYGSDFRKYYVRSENYNIYRAYLEAERGKRYNIRVKNNSNRRIGVIIAVDGRNILSGDKSYLGNNERMYVIEPYGSGTYDGWRTAKNMVNRFYFTQAADSYAGAWDDYSAIGTIAVAVFYERLPEPPPYSYERKGQADRSLRSAPSQPGTGFGESEYSPSRRVHFEPEPYPVEKHIMKYEWRETLCKNGIIDCGYSRDKNRFWDNQQDYVPYPPRRIR